METLKNNAYICEECKKEFSNLKGLKNHNRFGCSTKLHANYFKYCPKCNEKIIYESKTKYDYAIKNNTRCQKCSNIGRNVTNDTKKKIASALMKKYESGELIPNMSGAHSSASRKKQSEKKKNSNLTESHKLNISIGLNKSEKFKTAIHSKERGKKISKKLKNKKFSEEHKNNLSKSHTDVTNENNPFFNKKHTNTAKNKMRIKAIDRISTNLCNGYQIIPFYNKNGCEYFNNLMKTNNCFIQHAENGGEFYIKKLGYFVDGYDEKNNIVYEWDEKHHYQRGKLSEKDIIRENEITNLLKCTFIRIKESEVIND
jgi:hypothetical protein